MFLNALNKKQKTLFLNLAVKAAEANGVVELEEKNLLKAYALEMEIPPFYSSDRDTDTLLQDIKEICGEREQKIILFEILGVLISDKEFDDCEKEFFSKLQASFEVSQDTCSEMLRLLNEYSALYQKIVKTVL